MAEQITPNLNNLLKGNDNDILLVANIDVGCSDETTDVVVNMDTREETYETWNHKDYFQVKWGGRPHRIIPGATKRMPRWLAKHYGKHLADHMLQKQELPINHATKRPEILARILLNVEEYFDEPPEISEGVKVEKEVDALNEDIPTPANIDPGIPNPGAGSSTVLSESNLGNMPDPVLGNLRPPEPDVKEVIKAVGKDGKWDADKPKPTRDQLIVEIGKLGLEDKLKPNMKVDDLIGIIRSF